MNKLTKAHSLAGLAGASALLLAAHAGATPVLHLDYANNIGADEQAFVIDGGMRDTSSLDNVVVAGGLLSVLDVNIAIGSIVDDPGAQFSMVVSDFSGPTDGTLTATFADTGFTGGTVITFVNDFVANSGFDAEATLIVTLDNCNILLDTGCVGTEVYSGPANLMQTAVYDFTGIASYGLAMVQTFTIDEQRPFGFSGDYSLTMPEPTTLALLGFGALAFGASRRRRA